MGAKKRTANPPQDITGRSIPGLISQDGANAVRRYTDFFELHIGNPNTRLAYSKAVGEFCQWAADRRYKLRALKAAHVRAFAESVEARWSVSSINLHLAALRTLFDWFIAGGVLDSNPAAGVSASLVNTARAIPQLKSDEARRLLKSIDRKTIAGLRDRALLGVMLYSFAPVSAAIGMNVADYVLRDARRVVRLEGKRHATREVPAHSQGGRYLEQYIAALRKWGYDDGPLFRTIKGRTGIPTVNRMSRIDALRMIKRRAVAAGLPSGTCCRTVQGIGISNFLANGGSIFTAKVIAGNISAATLLRYDYATHPVPPKEIERIAI